MAEKLPQEVAMELMAKIDSEGFDYYFTSYGADDQLQKMVGKEINAYKKSKEALEEALKKIGIDMDLY